MSEENKHTFRLAIFGTNEESRELYNQFKCNLCNVQMFDNLEDLLFWQPNTIMFVDGELAVIHQLIIQTKVAINIFTEIDIDSAQHLIDDYRGFESNQRITYRVVDKIWAGTPEAINNTKRLYNLFAKEQGIEVDELITVFEGAAMQVRLKEYNKIIAEWEEGNINKANEINMPTYRLNRLVKNVAYKAKS